MRPRLDSSLEIQEDGSGTSASRPSETRFAVPAWREQPDLDAKFQFSLSSRADQAEEPSTSGRPGENQGFSLPGWLPRRGNKHRQRTKRGLSNLLFASITVGKDTAPPPREPWKLPQWLAPKLPSIPNPFWVVLNPPGQPDKKRLMTVQDFFKYTEEEGRAFFNAMDQNGDGRVTYDDVKAAMRKRNLPEQYAKDFIHAARGNRWWANSFGWEEFRGLMDEREPKMLRAFTSMEVSPAGGLEQRHIKGTLSKVGVDASDENARAMIKALGAEEDGVVSYGRFRNFLILLPEAKLTEVDPSRVWFEAATIVPFGPPPKEQGTRKMLVTAALAGGIASCTSTVALFPLDTLKTRLQSTPGITLASLARSAPSIGLRGLYRGILPAASGSFVSHGLRTCSYEGSLALLKTLSGGAAELQMQGLASGMGTFLGTCVRIPCEVLKQRLQIGRHANVAEAVRAATATEGTRGLFRGTTATLAREVPFYMCGTILFEQLKRVAQGSMFGGRGRELESWEVIALGALAGALGCIATTPADVMKTRIMTAAVDQAVNPRAMLADIIRNEGFGALFKGALARSVWVAPLGAMNFGAYELAKKAMSQRDQQGQEGGAVAAVAQQTEEEA